MELQGPAAEARLIAFVRPGAFMQIVRLKITFDFEIVPAAERPVTLTDNAVRKTQERLEVGISIHGVQLANQAVPQAVQALQRGLDDHHAFGWRGGYHPERFASGHAGMSAH